jgi:GNAT superfamily N-acetyltransferase
MALIIERASSPDVFEYIWPFFKDIVAAGDTYLYPMTCTYEQGKHFWMPEQGSTYLARQNNDVVGSFYLKPNQPGLGDHVANAGYMVNPAIFGKGIGRAMGEFSIEEARKLGYKAMQFNAVVSTNTYAVRLWESLGFSIVGTSPQSFRLQGSTLVDTYIMHRFI